MFNTSSEYIIMCKYVCECIYIRGNNCVTLNQPTVYSLHHFLNVIQTANNCPPVLHQSGANFVCPTTHVNRQAHAT